MGGGPVPGGPAHFFHGTKAALRAGDRIVPGHAANYGARRRAGWVYMTARLEIAILAAERVLVDDLDRHPERDLLRVGLDADQVALERAGNAHLHAELVRLPGLAFADALHLRRVPGVELG